MKTRIRLAHLSDWHATSLVGAGPEAFFGKRLSGYASWALRRRHHHAPEILAAAIRDVQAQAVDHVVVTGDLTHVSLPAEFEVAREQLERLGPPDRVFLVPGNHDCYVPVEPARGWDRWAPYLRGLAPDAVGAELAPALHPPASAACAPRHADFPTLRLVGRVALVGLCSSIPTPIFRAGGELGASQRTRLRTLLTALDRQGYFRVVLIHHPVHPHGEPERRALWDGAALRALLAEVGAELVLHGHKHRRRVHFLEGPKGPIPALGVPSSSEVGSRPDRRAQYHLFDIGADAAGSGFSLDVAVRGWEPGTRTFVPLPDRLLEHETG